MKYRAIIYDLAGPLLVLKKSVKFPKYVWEINQRCGEVTNDTRFIKKLENELNMSKKEAMTAFEFIVGSYKKNYPTWKFHYLVKKKYKTGIINNGTSVIFDRWVKKFKLADHFDVLLNSAKLGVKKPDRKIFEIMCYRLNVEPIESVYIDDNISNVKVAKELGFTGIHYQDQNKFFRTISRLDLL